MTPHVHARCRPRFSLTLVGSVAQILTNQESKLSMKVGVILPRISQKAFAAAIGVNLLIATKVPAQAIAPAAVASPPPAQMTTGATAEVERVIVTGSNIPTRGRDRAKPSGYVSPG